MLLTLNSKMSTVDDAEPQTSNVQAEEEKHKEQPRIIHDELIKLTKEAIANIIDSDPLLNDLPLDPTLDEIKAQLAVAQGQSIMLYLDRGPLPKLKIVVPAQLTNVLELKKAVQRHTNLALKRENVNKKISWKHVWKKYNLCFGDIILDNNNEDIRNYGITKRSLLRYAKKKKREK